MARKTAAESATAALTRLLNQRESARKKLADLDEEIVELRAILGCHVPIPPRAVASFQGPASMLNQHQHPIAEPEPELKLPDELAPQDDMGPGRLI